jgi:hypothetical protein
MKETEGRAFRESGKEATPEVARFKIFPGTRRKSLGHKGLVETIAQN